VIFRGSLEGRYGRVRGGQVVRLGARGGPWAVQHCVSSDHVASVRRALFLGQPHDAYGYKYNEPAGARTLLSMVYHNSGFW